MNSVESAKQYAAAILNSIREVSPDVVDSKGLMDALMTVTALVLTNAAEEWSEAGTQMLAKSFALGLGTTMNNIAAARANGTPLPLDNFRVTEH